MTDAERAGVGRLLREVRFDLLPLENALQQADYLPEAAEVAVTADPVIGMQPTIELATELSRRGFAVIPHLAAQLVANRAELTSYLDQLDEAGISRALVVGGVSDSPGEFPDAEALIAAIVEIGSPLSEIGIAGYPEGHHLIPQESLDRSLTKKAPTAAWITTQICFDVAQTAGWINDLRSRQIDLPIWLGVPAVADVTGLMSLGMQVGAGRSLQFMFEHPKLVTRLLRPGGGRASALILGLGEWAADEGRNVAGFHLFTYNQVGAAERWRQSLLARLS